MTALKKMSATEFRRLGYLQELNRRFLHPLGLALEVVVDEDGQESFGEVWDCRDDPEGVWFDWEAVGDGFRSNARRITVEAEAKATVRKQTLGFVMQPTHRSLVRLGGDG
jgi:hypothetical protein